MSTVLTRLFLRKFPLSTLRKYGRLLFTYLRPQAGRVALLTFLLLVGIGFQLANPQVIGYFIDTAQAKGPQGQLLAAGGLFLAFALVGRAVALGADYIADNVGWTATNALRADLARHVLRLDLSFHKKHTPGELIERLDSDLTALANFFSRFTIQVLGNILLVLGILALLFREDVWVGVGLTVYTVVLMAVMAAIQNTAVARWKQDRQARAELYGFIEERISGTEDIRANGAEPYVLVRLYRLLRSLLQKNLSARLVSTTTLFVTQALFVFGYGTGLALGAYLYTRGQVTIGAAFLIVYYVGMLSGPIESIRTQVQEAQQATASIERANEILALQPRVQDAGQAMKAPLPPGPLAVTFEHVSFRYEEEAPVEGAAILPPTDLVLQDISFQLPAGKVLGLLGRTGSGKSTLSRLLFRLYDPTAGSIRLDGLDLRQIPLEGLGQTVGLVTQDVQLFQATVRDNLSFFDRRVDDEQLIAVLQELQLWEWVQSLPKGLDTPLGAGGQGFSAGEAQLLAFARVFLRNPSLVILDEASSRLDPLTETRLEHAMDRLFQDRTGIVIAHRLRTVLRADEILLLENGRVAELGPRAQLAADPRSRFARLLQAGLEEALA